MASFRKSCSVQQFWKWCRNEGKSCRILAKDLEECKRLSRIVTEVTHNHPEGLKGAEAIAVCVLLAKIGKSKEDIRSYMKDNYYALNFTLEDLRKNYKWYSTCQESVP